MYFSTFPKIYYDGNGDGNHKVVTNLLRRVAVRAQVKTNASLFDTYDIKEGDSPESIAYKMYNDSNLHWIILLLNDITDRFHQWPKTTPQFNAFISEKYDNPNAVHHYEITATSGDTTKKIDIGIDNTDYPTASIVTNFEYEESVEDNNRKIRLIDPAHIQQFVKEFRELMQESSF
jgi:hypothetical protein